MTAAVLVAAFFGPGLCFVLTGWRVAGRWLSVTAPAISVLLIGWVGWAGGRVGVTPSPGALLLLAAVLGLLAGLGLRLLVRGQALAARTPRVPALATIGVAAIGVGAAATLTTWLWTRTPGWALAIPNYFDGTWHGYLLGVVTRTGIVDPQRLVPLDPQLLDWLDYYPTGWHVPVGSAVSLTGSTVPYGYSVGQLLFAAVVLPLGVVALVRTLGLRSRIVLVLAPVLVALAYPVQGYLVATVAFAVALALVPAALAAVVTADRSGWQLPQTLMAAATTAGVFLVQPSAVIIIGLVAACYVFARLRRADAQHRLLGFGGWVLATAALALPWLLQSVTHARETLDYSREGQLPYLDGAYELLVQYREMAPAPTLPVAVGLAAVVLLVARRHRWLVAATALFGALYLVALSAGSPLRQILTGFWYTDWYRLGGSFWLLAALLMLAALDVLVHALRTESGTRVLAAVAVVGLAVTVGLAGPVWASAVQGRLDRARGSASPLVTASDRLGFAYLRDHVPPGQRVLNDWPDGSGWMYALEGVDPLIATVGSNLDPDRIYLIEHFDELGDNPRVRELLRRYDISYVYTDTTRDRVAPYRLTLPPGNAGLTLVFRQDRTRIFRITG